MKGELGSMTTDSRRTHALTGWITLKRIAIGTAIAAFLALSGGSLFWAHWVLNSWGAALESIITTEGQAGYRILISPAESDLLANNNITGEKVAFLPKSDMNIADPTELFLFTSHEAGALSGVTRIDLVTGEADIIVSYQDHDFNNLDGLLWTPWNTLLVDEETTNGRLFEILNPLSPPGDVDVVERTAFGRRRNEGLAIDRRGYLYGVDEIPDGAIFRFRPDAPLTPGFLESGTLDVLVADAGVASLERGRVSALGA